MNWSRDCAQPLSNIAKPKIPNPEAQSPECYLIFTTIREKATKATLGTLFGQFFFIVVWRNAVLVLTASPHTGKARPSVSFLPS